MRQIDIALVVDVSASMKDTLANLSEKIATIIHTLQDEYCRGSRALKAFRVRVIAFRDFAIHGEKYPIQQTNFYNVMDEHEYARLMFIIDHLQAFGGSDRPGSALEALHYAFRSDWSRHESLDVRARSLIIVLTDKPANAFGNPDALSNPLYPKDMPASLIELEAEYESLINMSKYLFIMAPGGNMNDPEHCTDWNELLWFSGCEMLEYGVDLSPFSIKELAERMYFIVDGS